jgi:Holliday junction resolvasome RuvABC ATP-dependent DNA helicase subunit
MFQEIIGQDHIKSSLAFYAEGAKKGGAVPPILFTGARGLGKTMMAREFGKILKRPILEINCSTIKNNTQFFEQVFVPVVMGNEIVLIFDECHALPRELQNAFLTVFNVEKSSRKQFEWQGSTMEFDFTKQTYLFATTEPDKIFTPLKDRFEEIDFRPYTDNELGKILQKRADWVALDGSLVPVIAETLRGNARSAVKRAKQIEMFCENKNISKFGANEWKQMCDVLGIKPNGLTNAEMQVLQILKERGACTLAMLSAATGLSRTALQKDIEMHLLRKGYMKIEGLRMITGAGQNALSKV